MDYVGDYADDRLISGCIYCRGRVGTQEHVPSKVFLDKPYPDDLPVIGACRECNNGFSLDEQYVACLIESVIAGTCDPAQIKRVGIAKALERSAALRKRIEAGASIENGVSVFRPEHDRVERVLLKLARGHAAYELSQPCHEEPSIMWWQPLGFLSQEQREAFDAPHVVTMFGEIGSRSQQRMQVVSVDMVSESGERTTQGLIINDWIDVQEGRYRFQAVDDVGGIRIRIVISEYLACEVGWI